MQLQQYSSFVLARAVPNATATILLLVQFPQNLLFCRIFGLDRFPALRRRNPLAAFAASCRPLKKAGESQPFSAIARNKGSSSA
jgi:hypothetical protein